MIAFLSARTRTPLGIHPIVTSIFAPLPNLRPFRHGLSQRLLRQSISSARSYQSTSLRYQAVTAPKDDISYHNKTIYALSTAPGKAAIAVIRISGSACIEIYKALCPGTKLPKARVATLRPLYTPYQPPSPDTVLDSGALILYFPGPKTVTGEDVLELHVHGGQAIVKSVLAAISKSTAAVRYAEPGEFTRRAFFNDRVDLIQVEALGDVLTATTEQQARLALRGTTSGLAKRYESWRELLLYSRGELEALIDFSEDQHFDESSDELVVSVSKQVHVLRQQIDLHRANAVRGELLRNGISFAFLGAPNVGKSSLLNSIVGREAAIVSSEAGTTRDVVDVGIDLGGWFCKFGDTAGLRQSGSQILNKNDTSSSTPPSGAVGAIEREGIKRAKQRASEADVVIVVCAIELDSAGKPELVLDPEVQDTARKCIDGGAEVIVVVNKIDRLSEATGSEEKAQMQQKLHEQLSITQDRIFFISCIERLRHHGTEQDHGGVHSLFQGIITLLKRMTDPVGQYEGDKMMDPSVWSESLGATERHRMLLEECLEHLDDFLALTYSMQEPRSAGSDEIDIVVAAEDLRAAASSLARITGRREGDSEDVLGVVFEKFCVGK